MIQLFSPTYWMSLEISWLDLFIFIAAVTLFILMWKRKSSAFETMLSQAEVDLKKVDAKLAQINDQKPIAVIQFDRSEGHENETPKVISCDWFMDGTYQVYLSPVASDADLRAENERLRHDANELRDLKASILQSKTLADFNTVFLTVIAISALNPSEQQT